MKIRYSLYALSALFGRDGRSDRDSVEEVMENLSKRILVVDDDQGILDSFEVLLGDRFDLVKAENGYKALQILKDDPPNLMFLDIKMPGIDGIDILRRLHEEKKEVDVVIITASQQECVEDEARSFGILNYLRKPLDIFEIDRITSQVFA
jgi:two-component system response regulator (stage 0 sporulation protein F)